MHHSKQTTSVPFLSLFALTISIGIEPLFANPAAIVPGGPVTDVDSLDMGNGKHVANGNFAYANNRMFALNDANLMDMAKRSVPWKKNAPSAFVPKQIGTSNDEDNQFAFAFAKRAAKFAKRNGARPFAVEVIEMGPPNEDGTRFAIVNDF